MNELEHKIARTLGPYIKFETFHGNLLLCTQVGISFYFGTQCCI